MKHLPSAAAVAKLTKPGRYAVGHGAYLQVSEWKTRAWIFRYSHNGRAKHLGLGSCEYVSLAKAREKAIECRRLLADGIDPLEQKRNAALEQRLAATRSRTFRQCAIDFVAAHEDGWRGDRSRQQWLRSLQEYAFPVMADVPIAAVGVAEVLAALERAREVPETQRRLRNRIANILDWAISRELRPNDNPAKRPGLLPKRKRQVAHFAAMPYAAVPVFLAELRQRPEPAARALEFQILTAGRPGEVLGARWDEIEGNIWVVPGERMKSGKPHRVPLSDAVVRLLRKLPRPGSTSSPTATAASCTTWPWCGCCALWAATRPRTAFDRASATGRPSRRATRTTSSSKRWRTRSAPGSRRHTDVLTCSKSAGG
jgi:integrase